LIAEGQKKGTIRKCRRESYKKVSSIVTGDICIHSILGRPNFLAQCGHCAYGIFLDCELGRLPILTKCDKYLLNNEINPAIFQKSRDLLFCALQLL